VVIQSDAKDLLSVTLFAPIEFQRLSIADFADDADLRGNRMRMVFINQQFLLVSSAHVRLAREIRDPNSLNPSTVAGSAAPQINRRTTHRQPVTSQPR